MAAGPDTLSGVNVPPMTDEHEHRSLFILDDPKNGYIEHTCACWLPVWGREGILDVPRDRSDALEPQTWRGLGPTHSP